VSEQLVSDLRWWADRQERVTRTAGLVKLLCDAADALAAAQPPAPEPLAECGTSHPGLDCSGKPAPEPSDLRHVVPCGECGHTVEVECEVGASVEVDRERLLRRLHLAFVESQDCVGIDIPNIHARIDDVFATQQDVGVSVPPIFTSGAVSDESAAGAPGHGDSLERRDAARSAASEEKP
jgi:hypothetical protein